MTSKQKNAIPDIQNLHDSRHLEINQVGIKSIRFPAKIKDKNGNTQQTIANFSMYVGLPHHFKGTHMSRFISILNNNEQEFSISSFEQMMRYMLLQLEAKTGIIEMQFPFFIQKSAPVSNVKSMMDYEVSFLGEIHKDGHYELWIKMVVPATSLCPCSKEISQYGAHNQRSHITVSVLLKKHIWIEDLITLVESEASCEIFSLLKRPDEKYVTEHAYENPKFVEDIVRDVAKVMNDEAGIVAYKVEAENFESIHNHSAYAMIQKDKRKLEKN